MGIIQRSIQRHPVAGGTDSAIVGFGEKFSSPFSRQKKAKRIIFGNNTKCFALIRI
jgi:hypothetical protein